MAHAKRKSISHIIDDKAIAIIKNTLPNYWEVREYSPDYGIDLAVEIFEKSKDNIDCFDTLGEHFFVQVKGQESVKTIKYNIYEQDNKNNKIFKTIDVVTFSMETDFLFTVQKMSSGIPVMLFVVDITNENIYFINVNDYIENILLREDPEYYKKNNKTIYIPIKNNISKENLNFLPLKYYAKRPKFYSLFSKITLWNEELKYTNSGRYPHKLWEYAKYLLSQDIFNYYKELKFLKIYRNSLYRILHEKRLFEKAELQPIVKTFTINEDESVLFTEEGGLSILNMISAWEKLILMQGMYEDNQRHLYLPCYLNYLD